MSIGILQAFLHNIMNSSLGIFVCIIAILNRTCAMNLEPLDSYNEDDVDSLLSFLNVKFVFLEQKLPPFTDT